MYHRRWTVWFAALLVLVSFGVGIWVSRMHRTMPNFSAIHSFQQRQTVFIAYMLPMVRQANQSIQLQSHHLQRLAGQWQKHPVMAPHEATWLQQLAEQYRVEYAPYQHSFWSSLTYRIKPIPASLVLAQAINESAWGTSRFAQQGYNLFGQWCYSQGCGLVPNRRNQGAEHEVRVFATPYASVQAYMQNLNSNPSYAKLRKIRWQYPAASGATLAEGLSGYSEKGQVYVRILQRIIRDYHLSQYD